MNLDHFCKLELRNNIVHAMYADDVVIDLSTAKAIVKERRRIANNLPHKVIVPGGPISISADARKFALSEESNALISAWAIVTEENLLKLTFFKLLFFTQNRKHKMRFFKDEASGLKWLNSPELDTSDTLFKKEILL